LATQFRNGRARGHLGTATEVGRVRPGVPREVAQTRTFRTPSDPRGAPVRTRPASTGEGARAGVNGGNKPRTGGAHEKHPRNTRGTPEGASQQCPGQHAFPWLWGGLLVAITSQAGALPPVCPLYSPCIEYAGKWLGPGLARPLPRLSALARLQLAANEDLGPSPSIPNTASAILAGDLIWRLYRHGKPGNRIF
jgi:hypothetical protein